MFTLYYVCAAVGGGLLLLLFLLSLTGITDLFEGDAGEALTDVDGGDAFQVLSVRSLLAGLSFFGLGGALAHSAGAGVYFTFIVAVFAGVSALLLVAWAMHLLMSLAHDGTVSNEEALGTHGICYLAIPAARGGTGKVTVTVQNRSLELQAMTGGAAIPTGAQIEVVSFIEPNLVEVIPLTQEGV